MCNLYCGKIINKINKINKGKGAASAKPPQFHEVCEQVKALVDQGEPIPPSLMAKLLKFRLLHVKQRDLERREEEKKVHSCNQMNYIFHT